MSGSVNSGVVSNPFFARIWTVMSAHETEALTRLRRENLDGLSGRVLEVGAGTGTNFAHYPPTVAEVLAVEQAMHAKTQADWQQQRPTVQARVDALTTQRGLLETQLELLARIHGLEEQRQHLRDGESCPLCGSEEHPWAQGNVPAANETRESLARHGVETIACDLLDRAAHEVLVEYLHAAVVVVGDNLPLTFIEGGTPAVIKRSDAFLCAISFRNEVKSMLLMANSASDETCPGEPVPFRFV